VQNEKYKAKVFISCGQRTLEERNIAEKIFGELMQLGFDPYIAVQEQTLRGLKENIFRQIEKSEYFLFIDFKRERISRLFKNVFRGSLFSNQELALASFLNINFLAFQEKGVKKEDGIMKFIQGNCVEFSDRRTLPNLVIELVKDKKWDSNWKNQLAVSCKSNYFVDNVGIFDNSGKIIGTGRYYYVRIKNLHLKRPAINCYAYLMRAVDKSKGITLFNAETPELKWAGYTLPNALISPQSYRKLDAFWINLNNPTKLNFNIFTDYTGYIRTIIGPGNFELFYMVVSENFDILRFKLLIDIGKTVNDIKVRFIKTI